MDSTWSTTGRLWHQFDKKELANLFLDPAPVGQKPINPDPRLNNGQELISFLKLFCYWYQGTCHIWANKHGLPGRSGSIIIFLKQKSVLDRFMIYDHRTIAASSSFLQRVRFLFKIRLTRKYKEKQCVWSQVLIYARRNLSLILVLCHFTVDFLNFFNSTGFISHHREKVQLSFSENRLQALGCARWC